MSERRKKTFLMTDVSLKQKLGCWLNERWRTELILRTPALAKMLGMSWLDLCNRNERLSKDDQSGGRICHWKDSSKLTVSRFFPVVGQRILDLAMQEWPFRFATPEEIASKCRPANPDVSIVMVVRGTGRLPQFQATLASLLAQEGCEIEIVVVEQSEIKEFESFIPACVKYIHTPTSVPFNRSWGLNVGVRNSNGRNIIIYDADMITPVAMAMSVCQQLDQGVKEALLLSRLMFYLDQSTSHRVQQKHSFEDNVFIENVTQNTNNPIAIRREAYLRIGGHDESFFRWGGEDDEFMSRLRTLKLVEGRYLPILHLWHEAASNKLGDRNQAHLTSCLNISVLQRIKTLSQKPFGEMVPSASLTR